MGTSWLTVQGLQQLDLLVVPAWLYLGGRPAPRSRVHAARPLKHLYGGHLFHIVTWKSERVRLEKRFAHVRKHDTLQRRPRGASGLGRRTD